MVSAGFTAKALADGLSLLATVELDFAVEAMHYETFTL